MRIIKLTVVTGIICLFVSTACFSADVVKIGIVDYQKILVESAEGKKAQGEINRQGNKMKAELEAKQAMLEKEKQGYERESLVMGKEMREQKERDLQAMFNDFLKLRKQSEQTLRQYQVKTLKTIRDDILVLVEKIAKKEGYLMVIERGEGGLMYYPKSVDLTKKVIKAYDKQGPGKAGKK